MRFSKFIFKNFKGIEELEFDLTRNAYSTVTTLVGLNESGKTTILEAINYFVYKNETLDALKLDGYKIENIHELIPISKRDNFNDFITIEGHLELDENDIQNIKKEFTDSLIRSSTHFILPNVFTEGFDHLKDQQPYSQS